jgi:uncharacterized membrane protein YoaK (UPF0700 family)
MRVAVSPFYGLSFAAGCVDAISFVGFGGVFTANMTGNTVLLGIAIASRLGVVPRTVGIVPPLVAIAAFVVGAIAALPVLRAQFELRRAARIVLAEAVLVGLASLAFDGLRNDFVIPLCIVLVSFAMGAQSIVAAKAGLPGISTTYVTGTLVTAVTKGLFAGSDDLGRRQAARAARTWVVYLAGAALGGLLFIGFHRAALWPAVAVFVANAGWLACSVPSTSSSKA